MMKHFIVGLLAALAFTAGCDTLHHYGNGRVAKVAKAESISVWGVTQSFAQLQNCEETENPASITDPTAPAYIYTDCQPLTDWVSADAPGPGPVIAAGAVSGAAIGAGIASMPASSMIQNGGTSSSTSSAVSSSSSSASSVSKGFVPPGIGKK